MHVLMKGVHSSSIGEFGKAVFKIVQKSFLEKSLISSQVQDKGVVTGNRSVKVFLVSREDDDSSRVWVHILGYFVLSRGKNSLILIEAVINAQIFENLDALFPLQTGIQD